MREDVRMEQKWQNHNTKFVLYNVSITSNRCIMQDVSGAGPADPTGAPEFTIGFSGVCIRSLVFCVVIC